MDKQTSNPLAVRKPVAVEVPRARSRVAFRPSPQPAPRAGTAPQLIEVSLTKFADFILKNGTAKLTVVKEAKEQSQNEYDPMSDFYKRLREGLIKFHKGGADKSALDAILDDIKNKMKLKNYPDLIGGYKRFLGRRTYRWFQPPKADWTHGDLAVRVNPELGLELGGAKMAVKLYLRTQGELDKRRAALITHVMHSVLGAKDPAMAICVLDVKNGRNYPCGTIDSALAPVLRGEALSFLEMYRSL